MARWLLAGWLVARWLVAGGWWLVAGGWWLVASGWWLVAGGWWLVAVVPKKKRCLGGKGPQILGIFLKNIYQILFSYIHTHMICKKILARMLYMGLKFWTS